MFRVQSLGIEDVLAVAEERVAAGESLARCGFWQAVAAVKGNPELAERFGPRIAAIDDAAFRRWAALVVPITPGTLLASVATAGGLFLIGWAYSLQGLAAVLAFYAGFGVVLVTTHGLAHLLVGRLLGIRFTAWFVGTMKRPQPGVKVDYGSYLAAPGASRAWMHASGAIVSKLVPFALIGAALAAELPSSAVWGLAAIGVASIVTDIIWSTKKSDWKKFKREMSAAQIS